MAGRPTKYTPELQQAAIDYITEYETVHGHTVPSVVGMAVVLNIAKSTLYDWASDETKDFSDTLEKCNDQQHMTLINKGLKGDFNSTITKLALANHGYSEKTQTDVTSGGKPLNDWHIHPVSNDKDG